jgi:hypothetical protein
MPAEFSGMVQLSAIALAYAGLAAPHEANDLARQGNRERAIRSGRSQVVRQFFAAHLCILGEKDAFGS